MSASISPDDVARVARLARLDLEPDELARFTAQLGGIVEHFRDIDALDLSGIEPMTQAFEMVNVLRDDEVRPCLDRAEVLAAAPAAAEGRFAVPPILESEDRSVSGGPQRTGTKPA